MSMLHVQPSVCTQKSVGPSASLRRRSLAALLQVAIILSVALAAAAPNLFQARVAEAAVSDDWPTFLHDAARSSKSVDTGLTTANAGQLRQVFAAATGGPLVSSPAIVNGTVYVGSWDGYEYAFNATTGALKWKTLTGITHDPPCHPPDIGITSSAAVVNGVVYVGGGDAYWYALNATDGSVLWKVFTGTTPRPVRTTTGPVP